ncbi:TetR/AcrR family transcriptional regulator [Pseudomonas sp. MAFF212428]|uniref:TetR/AcrR family transcriptional regulator n=1 Tax=Pseudomonas brassicae TaxID=2708063 RepID=A0A6M0CWP8_9PSED|nr:TetR/AcrR family transcriptional regulator [Pseudomonas brassicae]
MAEASHGCARFILEAARPLLAQAGYAGMSMRQLASQAGVLPGSLYHHVTGKQELLLWVVQDVLERRAAAWQALPRRRHALAEVRSFIGFMLAWQAEHPGEAHILRHEHRHLAPHQQAWLARHIHSAQACLQSVLQRGRRQGVCGGHRRRVGGVGHPGVDRRRRVQASGAHRAACAAHGPALAGGARASQRVTRIGVMRCYDARMSHPKDAAVRHEEA